jgi:peptide/nickel transport system substrate-binding protein
VRAISDDTVELELARAAPDLPLLLATPAASVTPGGAPPSKRPVGTGPFAVESVDAQAVRLVAWANCFAGRPYLDRLVLRAFASRTEEAGSFEIGALHGARHGPYAFEGNQPRRPPSVAEGPQTITGFLAVGRGPDEALLRRALSLGINRERLRRMAVREPSVTAIGGAPPALGGTSGKPLYDPARARAEIDRRYRGERPKLSLLVDASRFDDRDLADRILGDLTRLGIDVTIEPVDAAQYQARLEAGRYDLALGAAVPPAPDGGLAVLALLAAVDPAAARAQLSRAPASAPASAPAPGSLDLETTRIVPLFHRAARLFHSADLHGLTVDGAGRGGWADARFPQPR